MKPQPINRTALKSSGIQTSVKFGIKDSGIAHIFNVLRNQLYSDKILAVMREYSTNAVDAHVEVGKRDKPIEVTLPNRLEPIFKVRDFGPSLNDEEIKDVYAFYGESTKRNTNDQTGQLGLGSKSAFAYGDNFVINSFIGGKKHTYNAFIDPSQVGQISKLSIEDTDEEDGVEIVVPVHSNDFDEFKEKALNLYKYFDVKPIIHGLQSNHEWKAIIEKKENVLFAGDGWKWMEVRNENFYGRHRGDAVVIMGNIGYPIDEDALNLNDNEYSLRNLLCENLVLTLPIGDLEMSASREALQYTDFTRKNLVKKLKEIQRDIGKQIGEEFAGANTLHDAKCLFGSTFRTDSPLYQLKDTLKDHLFFSKLPVKSGSWDLYEYTPNSTYDDTGEKVRIAKFKKTHRSQRYKTEETSTIDCEKNVVIIENDMGHRRGLMGKILPLIHNEKKTPYLIEFGSSKVKKNMMKKSMFDAPMVKLSSLPKQKLSEFDGYQTSAGGSSYDSNPKHSAKCFEYNFDKSDSMRRYHTCKSDYWSIAEVDIENENGVYVIIDKFQIEVPPKDKDSCSHNRDPYNLKSLKETIEQAGIKFPKHIYAFKVAQRKTIEGKDGWVELNTWAKQQLEAIIAFDNLNQAWIDIQKIDDLNRYSNPEDSGYGSSTESIIQGFKKLNLTDKAGLMSGFVVKHSEMKQDKKVHSQIKGIQAISKEYDVEFSCPKGVKPTYDIKKLFQDVLDKYDMIALVNNRCWDYESTSKKQKTIQNYVNVIDICQND